MPESSSENTRSPDPGAEAAPSAPKASPTPPRGPAARLADRLMQPVDVASLVVFRIAMGAILLWEVYRYFSEDRIFRYYIEPQFFFTYFGFGWVHPWPGKWMFAHFIGLGVCSLLIVFGLFYRWAMALFFVGFTYVFLLDQSRHLNHFYLVCLVSLLMVFIPAHRTLSLDARWKLTKRRDTAPTWALWLLRAQIGLVYFYGGVAKLNSDWLHGEPVRTWIAERTDVPVLGPFLDKEWMAWIFAYGGLAFDLFVAPALLWRRTRAVAFAVAVVFHLTNFMVFSIGIFPWFMIAATTLFFEPGWPRRFLLFGLRAKTEPEPAPSPARRRVVLSLVGGYLAIQVLMPLRHFLYPGNVHWTEEGHRFSWHMKLRDKDGEAQFFVTDVAKNDTHMVDPADTLDETQVDKMPTRPDMVLQFAHHLAAEARRQGVTNVEVRARVMVTLNGRDPQMMIDPGVNLAAVPRSLRRAHWIRPLTEPLPPRHKARKPPAED